jgi:hypothetical protein
MDVLFDIKSYYKYNNDLKHLDEDELFSHWNNFGKYEDRVYYKCDELNKMSHNIYRLCNPDLYKLSDSELETHLAKHGLKEKRVYSINTFIENTKNFVQNNEDLIKNYTELNEECVVDYLNEKKIYVKLMGGLGNQIFMLLNMIALGEKFNKKVYIHENFSDKKRKSFRNYSFFKNMKIINDDDKFNNFDTYYEKQHYYSEINLNLNKNYLLSGYFQSYKYFWENQDEIRKQIHIDKIIQTKINNILSKYKKIIAIHLRLGDYLELSDYHPIMPIEYYKKALSYYNLDDYQIILFSDDIKMAIEKLKPLNLDLIDAGTLFENDEEDFYALCNCDVRICANSSFSLMSCYLNEIFELKKNCEYIFPNVWFGPEGPEYKMDDIMPNYKFHVIDLKNINYDVKYDVVTTIHSKDKERYELFMKYNKKNLIGAGTFNYVSYKNLNNEGNYISEKLYPFSKEDVINYIKDYIPDFRWGWYYQQLLKLYIFEINEFDHDNVLIFDSDILLLKELNLFDENTNKMKIFKRLTGDMKIHTPYKKCMEYILSNVNKNEDDDSGICHMMIFNKQIIKQLFADIETKHNKKLWKVCLDGVIKYVNENGYTMSILSEYELYYNYVKNNYMEKYVIDNNFKYLDMSINKFNFNRNKNKYNFIADHHYQSRNENDHEKDNLMDTDIKKDNIMISTEKISNLKLNKYINYLFKKYKNKDEIPYYNDSQHTDDNLLDILFEKLMPNCKITDLLDIFYINNYTKNDVINIIRNENLLLVKDIRFKIDDIINSFIINKKLKDNTFIKKISINVDLEKDKFHFGIIIPVFNRYYVTKIFFECLKINVNFESILFCIVDDGSEDDVLNELENLKLKSVVIYCDRKNNIYGSNNTLVPGSLYPLTLYMGHEIIKNNCNILGVLDSDSFINENYFNDAKLFTDNFNMNNTIFSGFNSNSEAHKIEDKTNMFNKKLLYKNMVGGISQFYSVKLYNEFKYKFTGEESPNFWAYDYDYQISNFMMKHNKNYICFENSNVQHIGIKSTMIRCGIKNQNDDNEIIDVIYKLLTNPNSRKNINVEFDFDMNFIGTNNIDKIFEKLNYSNKLNIYIDKIFYINLDERTDRKEIMEHQFKKFNMKNFERFPAIKPVFNYKYSEKFINEQINLYLNKQKIVDDLFENYSSNYIKDFNLEYIKNKNLINQKKYILGALGCKLSQLHIYKKCQNYKNIIIFEDDAQIHDNFIEYFNKLYDNLKDINFNYDIIWLCPNWVYKNNNGILNRCYSYKHIKENFALVSPTVSCDDMLGSTQNTAGIIINNEIAKYILDIYESSSQEEIDIWLRTNIQSQGKVYTPIPNLVTQRQEKSNIEEFEVNYSKDIHYKTRVKFNIYTILKSNQKNIYYKNIINNLQKMIGYEKIYYLCDEKIFDNEIFEYINIKYIENLCDINNINNINDINIIKNKFVSITNDNNIKYYYYMDVDEYLNENIYPFDENNNLIIPEKIIIKK